MVGCAVFIAIVVISGGALAGLRYCGQSLAVWQQFSDERPKGEEGCGWVGSAVCWVRWLAGDLRAREYFQGTTSKDSRYSMNLVESVIMKQLYSLWALASWIFFGAMNHLASTRLEIGFTIFRGGSVVVCCMGVYLMVASLWKRQGKLAFVGIIILLPALICWLLAFFGLGNWWAIGEIGGRELPMTIIVVDEETQKPISNALVRIIEEYDMATVTSGQSEALTAEGGKVNLMPELTYSATTKPFRRSGSIRFWGKIVVITAEEYQPLSVQLMELTGRMGISLYAPPLLPLTIAMKRKK
jgi:hypothetical protein